MKDRGISENLKRVKSYQSQQRILSEWANNWETDQKAVIEKLHNAVIYGDYEKVKRIISQLDGLTNKRFIALNNALRIISDPDRKLTDLRKAEESVMIKEPELKVEETIEVDNKISTQEQVSIKASSFDIDEIIKGYNAGMSVKEIAKWNNISVHKATKILVTAGVYSSDVYDKVKALREAGKSDVEIAAKLLLGKSVMDRYTPYSKAIYNSEIASTNAQNIRECRKRKKENKEE